MDNYPTRNNTGFDSPNFTSANSTAQNFGRGGQTHRSALHDTLLEQRMTGHLDLNDRYIGDEGADILANFLRQNPEVKSLMIRGNKISSEAFANICSALSATRGFTKLSAEWNNIGAGTKGLSALYEFVYYCLQLGSQIINIELS